MTLVDQLKSNKVVTDDLFNLKSGGKVAAIVPKDFTDIMNMSEIFYRSKMAPKSLDTAAKIAVAIQYGMEIGLPPVQALQNIAVVNGRPSLWGDALPALMFKHGHKLEETIEGEGDELVATCTLTRCDTGQVISRSFSMADAKRAGLLNKPIYKQYPQRMLPMRARSWTCRDGAPDAMVGLAVAEEVQDYSEPRNITPAPSQIEYEPSEDALAMIKEIEAFESTNNLEAWLPENSERHNELNKPDQQTVLKAYKNHLQILEEKEAANNRPANEDGKQADGDAPESEAANAS